MDGQVFSATINIGAHSFTWSDTGNIGSIYIMADAAQTITLPHISATTSDDLSKHSHRIRSIFKQSYDNNNCGTPARTTHCYSASYDIADPSSVGHRSADLTDLNTPTFTVAAGLPRSIWGPKIAGSGGGILKLVHDVMFEETVIAS